MAVATSGIYLRRNVFGRLYSDGWVPFSRRQHCHLVQKLIDACHQVISVFGFICHVMENLWRRNAKIRLENIRALNKIHTNPLFGSKCMHNKQTKKKRHWSHLISHQSSNRPANFMILWPFSQGTKQDEQKPVKETCYFLSSSISSTSSTVESK